MALVQLDTVLRYLHRTGDRAAAGAADGELLERFRDTGDQAAFELLLWRHGPMVLGLCRRLLRHEQDAEDAFQATFLTLARKARALRKRGAVGSWLYKVAYRVALDLRARTLGRAARQRPLIDVAGRDDATNLVWRDLRPVLDEEVSRLPERYRAPFVLCYLEGKTNEEAARQLGCPKGTVLSRLARARERLRVRLTRRGVALSVGLVAATTAEQAQAALRAPLVDAVLKAAVGGAGKAAAGAAISAQVAALTQGALQTMFWTKVRMVSMMMAVGILGSGGILATGWAVSGGTAAQALTSAPDQQDEQPVPAARGEQSPDERRQEARDRAESTNNLKQIALAMHNYLDQHGHFPPPAVYSKDGKALLSWRVLLLPYLEADALYRQFNLSESWDSPHNKALLARMPRPYTPPGARATPGSTYYQVFIGPGALFEKHRGTKIAEITDGTSNTILVAEGATPVPWTKPEDLVYDPDGPLPQLGGLFPRVFHVALADGSVHTLRKGADEQQLRWAVTRSGGEVLNFSGLHADEPRPDRAANPEVRQEEVAAWRAQAEALRDQLEMTRQELNRVKRELASIVGERRGRDLEPAGREDRDLRRSIGQLREEIRAVREEVRRLAESNRPPRDR